MTEIKPIKTDQTVKKQGNIDPKKEEGTSNFFDKKADGKQKDDSKGLTDVMPALDKEAGDAGGKEKADKKGEAKGKAKPPKPAKPAKPAGAGNMIPSQIIDPLIQAAIAGDDTALKQIQDYLSHQNPNMVNEATKAIDKVMAGRVQPK